MRSSRTANPPEAVCPPKWSNTSPAPCIISTTLTVPSERHEPRNSSPPSLPQINTGLPLACMSELATSPKTPGRQFGLPMTMTGLWASCSFCVMRLFTSLTIEATRPLRSSLIEFNFCASESASPQSLVASNFAAKSGESMREAALIRGVIINPTSSSVSMLGLMRKIERSCEMPGRRFLRITKSPKRASIRFSSTKGTMSESVASPTRSRYHFSIPGGSENRSRAKMPCTNFHATPAPHKPSNGYLLFNRFGLITAYAASGRISFPSSAWTKWWSVTITSIPFAFAYAMGSCSVVPKSIVMMSVTPAVCSSSIPPAFMP